MNDKSDRTAPSSVTVERSGARSVNLGRVLNTERAKEQLREIQKIERAQSDDRKRS
jgi:hypothetical protein